MSGCVGGRFFSQIANVRFVEELGVFVPALRLVDRG